MRPRIFLLSPARLGGPRSHLLLSDKASFEVAVKLRQGIATIAEVYSFISGLYFRGKIAYVDAFGCAPEGVPRAVVIVPGAGLIPPETVVSRDQIHAIANVPVEAVNDAFSAPLLRDARLLNEAAGPECEYVLLGSVASDKYTHPLLQIFGPRLLFPVEFVGRGDMSRGGLMLRCARSGDELSYVPVKGTVLKGQRPPKLPPLRRR